MKYLNVKIEEKVCYLGINRPEKKNALNKEIINGLITFLNTTKTNSEFKVMVLYGQGGIFSSGADLDWMKAGIDQSEEENLNDAKLFAELYRTLYKYPKPVISMIQKGAFGGAIGLIACSDIALADEEASFAFSEVRLGLVPATVSPYIVKKVGAAHARYMLLTASTFTAKEAFNAHLIQHITSASQLKIKTREIARNIAKMGPSAITLTKELLLKLEDGNFDENELDHYTTALIAGSRKSKEGQEGVTAFFEKRKPNWHESN